MPSIIGAIKTLGQIVSGNITSTNGTSLGAQLAAASMRAPLRKEILVVPVTAASVKFQVPNGQAGGGTQPDWRGKFINVFADGADVYIAFSILDDAAVNEATASAVASGVLTASGDECWKIPNGQWLPIAVPADALSFAVKGSGAGNLRTHIAET